MIAAHRLPILALVSGIPEPRRSARILVMLQVLIDESDSHTITPRIFIIGGYIATTEKWLSLTDAWRAELDRCPKLHYFSFKEAFPTSGKPNGQFRGMTYAKRDARVAKFRRIIEDHVHAEVGIGFQIEHYQHAYSWNKKMVNNHYLWVVPTLMPMTVRNMEAVDLPCQQMDFIFDSRVIDEPKVMDAWYFTKDNVTNPDPPDIFEKIIVNAPMFRRSDGDGGLIALQAADMFAGSTRAANIAHLNGKEPVPLPGTERNIRGIYLDATKDALAEEAESTRQRLIARGLL